LKLDTNAFTSFGFLYAHDDNPTKIKSLEKVLLEK
jgi:hypothetical protein